MKDLPGIGEAKEYSDGFTVHNTLEGLKVESSDKGYKLTFPDGAVKYHSALTRRKEPVKFIIVVKRIARIDRKGYGWRAVPLSEYQWELGASGASYESAIASARAKARNYGWREFDKESYVISVADLEPVDYQSILDELEDCKKRLEMASAPFEILKAIENGIDIAGAALFEGE